jgi:N-acyl-D-amino-acid deacylase
MAFLRKRYLGPAIAALALFLMVGGAAVDAQSPPPDEADLLITNGHVIDGTGSPWMQANVAIKGDRIVYVGRAPVKARKVLDVGGQVVSPGFIDMHSHSEFGLALDGRGLSKVTQGITTELLGEHLSAGPVLGPAVDDPMMVAPPVKRTWTTLGGFFSYLQKKGIGINVASYVGAGQVRASAMGYENRQPTPQEWDRMKQLIRQGMEEGAMGLSMGLAYAPNSFFSTQQLIDLSKVAAGYGGIYTIHLRSGPGLTGLNEAIEIAKDAHIPLEVLHVGGSIAHNPDFATTIEKARAAGIDVTANAYPYTIGWTYVRQLLPVWAQVGTADDIVARLKNPVTRARVIADLQKDPGPGHYAKWTISSANTDYDGYTMQQLADRAHVSVEEAMVDYLAKNHAEGFQIGPADPSIDQKEAETFRYPWIDVGSDGISLPAGVHTGFGKPHPRSFGSHVRILADVVRNRHILTLEEAIRHLSSQAADRLGLQDRGLLRQGMKADVVVFNPDTVQDTATYQKPDQYAKGISWVLVNGVPVVANGKPTNALPGQIVRGPAYKPGTP